MRCSVVEEITTSVHCEVSRSCIVVWRSLCRNRESDSTAACDRFTDTNWNMFWTVQHHRGNLFLTFSGTLLCLQMIHMQMVWSSLEATVWGTIVLALQLWHSISIFVIVIIDNNNQYHHHLHQIVRILYFTFTWFCLVFVSMYRQYCTLSVHFIFYYQIGAFSWFGHSLNSRCRNKW